MGGRQFYVFCTYIYISAGRLRGGFPEVAAKGGIPPRLGAACVFPKLASGKFQMYRGNNVPKTLLVKGACSMLGACVYAFCRITIDKDSGNNMTLDDFVPWRAFAPPP